MNTEPSVQRAARIATYDAMLGIANGVTIVDNADRDDPFIVEPTSVTVMTTRPASQSRWPKRHRPCST